MKAKIFISAVIIVTGLAGCSIQSLHPIYTEETTVYEPSVEGEWLDDDGNTWLLENAGSVVDSSAEGIWTAKNMYLVTLLDNDKKLRLQMFMVKLDDNYFLDFFPWSLYPNELGNDLIGSNLLPVHTFAKISFTNDQLLVSQFDGEWLYDLIKKNQIKISHEKLSIHGQNGLVLTASTKELQKFVLKYHAEEEAFLESDVFVRKK